MYLGKFIRTLGGSSGAYIQSVLNNAQQYQNNVDTLIKVLDNAVLGTLTLPKYSVDDRVSPGKISTGITNMNRYLKRLYQTDDSIEYLLNAMEKLQGSEIKAIEDEISSLEKVLDSFAFYLSDGKKYDGFFIETFSDSIQVDDSPNLPLSDRDGLAMDSSYRVNVDTDEGVAKSSLSNFTRKPVGEMMIRVAGVYDTTVHKNIGPELTGFKAVARTSSPVVGGYTTANGTNHTDEGMYVEVEYTLPGPTFCDIIRLSPLSNKQIYVQQIIAYESLEGQDAGADILSAPETEALTRPRSFSFAGTMVARFKVILRQPAYRRLVFGGGESAATTSQSIIADGYVDSYNAKKPHKGKIIRSPEFWHENNVGFRKGTGDRKHFTRLMFGDDNDGRSSLEPGSMGDLEDLKKLTKGPWRTTGRDIVGMKHPDMSPTERLDVRRKIRERLGRSLPDPMRKVLLDKTVANNRAGDSQNAPADYAETIGVTTDPVFQPPEYNQINPYVYELGLGDVSIGVAYPLMKSVYVSEPIEMNGDPGMVKLLAVDTRSVSTNINRDNKYLNSVEYSVSNASYPDTEEVWYPILPNGETSVLGERVFLNKDGIGKFRFPASLDEEIYVYINGIELKVNGGDIFVRDGQSYVGVTIPKGLYGVGDIITVSYTPVSGQNEIDFSLSPTYEDIPLAYPQNSKGKGEYVEFISGRREYQLSYTPYLDRNFVRDATYSASSGLDYNPITIKFDDGTSAVNLTNYQKGTQTSLSSSATEYQYIHTNNVIVFNKAPVSNMTITYQYIPARLRVRAILRCDDKVFSTPTVDMIQLKAKTRTPDIQRL